MLLLHEMPDGSRHYDWMIERADGAGDADEQVLMTFRLDRPLEAGVEGFWGERIGDHRRAYLTYEGPVSGGRGVVSRVLAGTCEILEETGTQVRVDLALGEVRGRFVGRVGEGQKWEFVLV